MNKTEKIFAIVCFAIGVIVFGYIGFTQFYCDVFDRISLRNGHGLMTVQEKEIFRDRVKLAYVGCYTSNMLEPRYIRGLNGRAEKYDFRVDMTCDEYKEVVEWQPYSKN